MHDFAVLKGNAALTAAIKAVSGVWTVKMRREQLRFKHAHPKKKDKGDVITIK